MNSNALSILLSSTLLFASLTSGCHAASQTTTLEATMKISNDHDPVVSLLTLVDDQYATLNDDEISDLELKLMDIIDQGDNAPAPHIWLGAPKQMSLQSPHTKLLMGLVYHGQREWEVYPSSNIFLLLRHNSTGQIWTASPLFNARRGQVQPLSAKGLAPDAIESASWNTQIQAIDLTDKFPLSMPHGSYTATALYFDLASNSVHFVLIDEKSKEVEIQSNTVITESHINTPKKAVLGSSMPLKFEARLKSSEIELWHGNLIALSVDKLPLIIPLGKDRVNISRDDKSNVSLSATLDLNELSKAWHVGEYQVYIDIGDAIIGPASLTVSK